jgi:hypothetical protein
MADNTTTSDPPRSTLIAVFDDRLAGENAVRDLEAAGFREDQIGYAIRGSDATLGGMITDASGTKDGKGAIAGAVTGGLAGGILAAAVTAMLPGVGPVLAAGSLAMFFGYAAAGTAVGGILGAMTGLGYSEEEARYYEQMFNEGKAILAVKPGPRCAEAADIVRRWGGYDLQAVRRSPVETTGMFSAP